MDCSDHSGNGSVGEEGRSLLQYERDLWRSGYRRVAGVDEVGRGPLAGPVVACAVVFARPETIPPGLTDSKKLSAVRREHLAEQVRECPDAAVGIGTVAATDIDRANILRATHLAMQRALSSLPFEPDFILVDGRPVPGLPAPSRALVCGDSLSASISAASIVAKVVRDETMVGLNDLYPAYEFLSNKGYGTPAHLRALERHGPCPVHRQSFAPVRRCAPGAKKQGELSL